MNGNSHTHASPQQPGRIDHSDRVATNCTQGFERSWLPVALASEVTAEPTQVMLMGEAWVVVRLPDGLFAARDRCPHRLAPLSIGCVVEETLQCRYHGWRFGSDGACVRIPSAGADKPIPQRARLSQPFGVAEHLGVVWIAIEEPVLGLPQLPEWGRPGFDCVHADPRRTTASAPQLMDNFVDASHFPTVHPTTFGVPTATELEIAGVVQGEWSVSMEYSTLYKNYDDPLVASGENPLEQPHTVEKTALAPFAVFLRLGFPLTESVFSILYAMQPESETSTRIYKLMARNDFNGDPARIADMLEFEDRVLDEDLDVLETFPHREVYLDTTVEVHTRADRLSLAYRRLLQRLADGFVEPASDID